MGWLEIVTVASPTLVVLAHQYYRYGQLVQEQRDQGRRLDALVAQNEWLRRETGMLKEQSVSREECRLDMKDSQEAIQRQIEVLGQFIKLHATMP